jgi:ribose transport system ATP-binding protein
MTTDYSEERSLLRVEQVSKSFGATRALSEVSITVMPGELVGLAGHNGAGKSTLIRSLAGLVRPDQGQIKLGDEVISSTSQGLSAKHARGLGIHAVDQELSLCGSLRVDESAAVVLRAAGFFGYRRRAWRQLKVMLDEIFPGHGIFASEHVTDLSIGKRQMLEIANAALTEHGDMALLILDEPTSALDADATANLYRWLRKKADGGLSAIVTTHRLNEMLSNLDRLYVMRDGRIVAEESTATLSRERLVSFMSGTAKLENGVNRDGIRADAGKEPTTDQLKVGIREFTNSELREISFEARAGDIIGLAGLEGQGQREILDAVFRAARSWRFSPRRRSITVNGKAAYVSGDRSVEGVFKFWSVGQNIAVSSLHSLCRWGWMSRAAELKLVAIWSKRLEIRGSEDALILSLSGGNQQKVLVARSLATGADIILLDDPTRGVDQNTKELIYEILREEADVGRCIIWYSTENSEFLHCDRVCVLWEGRVVGVLEGDEREESHVIAASFGPTSHGDS